MGMWRARSSPKSWTGRNDCYMFILGGTIHHERMRLMSNHVGHHAIVPVSDKVHILSHAVINKQLLEQMGGRQEIIVVVGILST